MHTQPCELLVDPDRFGTPTAEWKTDPGVGADAVAGALLQHVAAMAAVSALGKGAAEKLAGACRDSRSNVSRKLRGQIPVTTTDLGGWALVAGDDVLAGLPRTSADLLPERLRSRDQAWVAGSGRLPLLALAELDWPSVADAVARRFAEAGRAADRLIDAPILRYLTAVETLAHGISADAVFLDQPETAIGPVALSIGTAPDAAVEFSITPQSTSAAATRGSIVTVLSSIARVAITDASSRMVFAIGTPSGVGLGMATATVGSATAEAAGATDPLGIFWEADATVADTFAVGAEELLLVEVGKLRTI